MDKQTTGDFVIPAHAATRLIRVAKKFGPKAKVRRLGAWRSKADRYLWYCFLYQVMVPGGSDCVGRLEESGDHELLAYQRLCRTTSAEQQRVIHSLFRKHGVRWAGKRLDTCRKTRAVVYNLRMLRAAGGPKAYLRSICKPGRQHSAVAQIACDFRYIKLKGSQDLAAELGLSKDAIALDVRVLGVLKAAGVKVPAGVQSNPTKYAKVCAALLQQVCVPAGIEGYRLDRAFYQFNDEIVHHLRNRDS